MLGLYGKCSRALSRHLKGLSSGLPPLERCYAPVGYHTTHVRAAGNEHGKNGRYAYDRDANRVRYKYMLHERCTHRQLWHPAYRVSVKDKVTRTRVPRPVSPFLASGSYRPSLPRCCLDPRRRHERAASTGARRIGGQACRARAAPPTPSRETRASCGSAPHRRAGARRERAPRLAGRSVGKDIVGGRADAGAPAGDSGGVGFGIASHASTDADLAGEYPTPRRRTMWSSVEYACRFRMF